MFPSSYGVCYLINARILPQINHWHGTKILPICVTKHSIRHHKEIKEALQKSRPKNRLAQTPFLVLITKIAI